MLSAQIEIMLIASLISVACAVPGVFLVLRRRSRASSCITASHNSNYAVILGIVLAFIVSKTDYLSIPIFIFASLVGIATLLLVEWIARTGLVKEYAASAVVYSFMLSVAFVLVSILTVKVQLDMDAVLMGELAFAPLNRLVVGGNDIGAVAAYQAGCMATVNIILALFFYRNIKIALFDEGHATAMGMQPQRFQYALSIALSFTVVVSFESVGAIMVAGFIIGPAVIAMQLTRRLWLMLILASIAGIAATFCGYWLAHLLNASIIGSIMVVLGLFFALAFVLGANGGLLPQRRRRKSKQDIINMDIFLVHLWQHERTDSADEENSRYTIAEHLNWTNDLIVALIQAASKQDYLLVKPDGILHLLPRGIARARAAIGS